MRYTFADRLFPLRVIPEIIDMIFDYAYKKSKRQLHYESWSAKQCTHLMPTPKSWKHFLTNNQFDYSKFLRGDSMINIKAVKTALDLINWHSIRVKRCPLSRYTRITTKAAMKRGLSNMYIRDNIIQMVWLLLVTCTVGDFRVRAHTIPGLTSAYNIFCKIPLFSHPLSRYYPPHIPAEGIVTFLLDFNVIRADL